MVHVRVPENQIPAHKSIPISFVGNIYLQVVTCGVANWNKETPSTSTSAWVVPWCLQQKIEKQPGLTDVEEVPKYIHLAPSPSYIHFTTILWTHTKTTYPPVYSNTRPSPPWDLHKYPPGAVQSLWLLHLGVWWEKNRLTTSCYGKYPHDLQGFIHVRLLGM